MLHAVINTRQVEDHPLFTTFLLVRYHHPLYTDGRTGHPREVEQLAQLDQTPKWGGWDLNPGILTPEPVL